MVIYKTTNTINGKIYVGQTSKDLTVSSYLGSGVLLVKAIRKYGKKNFIQEILCECSTQSELDQMEDYWIKELDSRSRDIGYNLSEGGLGGSHGPLTECQKQKMRQTMKERGSINGEKNPFYGKRHTNETKEKIRIAKTGVKHSEEHNAKISQSQIGQKRSHKGRPASEDQKQKRLAGMLAGQAKRKLLGVKRKSPPAFSDEHRRNLSLATKKQWLKYKEKNNE